MHLKIELGELYFSSGWELWRVWGVDRAEMKERYIIYIGSTADCVR